MRWREVTNLLVNRMRLFGRQHPLDPLEGPGLERFDPELELQSLQADPHFDNFHCDPQDYQGT